MVVFSCTSPNAWMVAKAFPVAYRTMEARGWSMVALRQQELLHLP